MAGEEDMQVLVEGEMEASVNAIDSGRMSTNDLLMI
jgi:hypothetical protein